MKNIFLLCLLFATINLCSQNYFDRYKVDSIYLGEKSAIHLGDDKIVRAYRTRISKGYSQNGVNFAGHYSFIYWGCGSPCTGSAIVDVKTGRVYLGPDSGFGYNFVQNSRLLIVNPKDTISNSGQNPWDEVYTQEIWLWKERLKKFVKLSKL